MAQGDYTIGSYYLTTDTVTFQPSAGVSMVIKECTAEYQSATNYINLKNSAGSELGYIGGATGAMRASLFVSGTLYFNCTIFIDNSSYLQMTGTGSGTKGYTVGYVQISE